MRVTGTTRRYATSEVRIRDYATLIDAYGSYAGPAVGAVVARMDVAPLTD